MSLNSWHILQASTVGCHPSHVRTSSSVECGSPLPSRVFAFYLELGPLMLAGETRPAEALAREPRCAALPGSGLLLLWKSSRLFAIFGVQAPPSHPRAAFPRAATMPLNVTSFENFGTSGLVHRPARQGTSGPKPL